MYLVRISFKNGKSLTLAYLVHEHALNAIERYTKRSDVFYAVSGEYKGQLQKGRCKMCINY